MTARRKWLGVLFVICVTASAGYLSLRGHDSASAPGAGGDAGGTPSGSAPLSLEQMRGQLTAEERKAIDASAGADVREMYTRGFWLRRHPTVDSQHVGPLIAVIKKSPTKAPKGRSADNVLAHPYNAGYALAVLTRMWYVAGPMPYAADQLASEAVRLSACDDEVVQIQATMMLLVMHDKPAGSGLAPTAQRTLDQLLANDFIAQNVETQRKVLAEAAREAGK